jgi:hypothetical protein
MTKIPLKAITVTYTRTLQFIPTEEMNDEWSIDPSQESFESYALGELFDVICNDVRGNGDPMPYTVIQQGETVEIDWEDEFG